VGLALVGTRFAFATLIVNVLGCFVLGMLVHDGVTGNGRLALLAHPGVTVGFLGALTTFSTFGFQTIRFLEQGELRLAVINVVSNVVLGLLGAAGGMALSRMLGGGFEG
jgi:CrcB protein